MTTFPWHPSADKDTHGLDGMILYVASFLQGRVSGNTVLDVCSRK